MKDINSLNDYSTIKDRLFICLWNQKALHGYTAEIPHRELGDLTVVCYIKNGDKKAPLVTKKLLDEFGVSENQLFEDAMKSAPAILPAHSEKLATVLENIYLHFPQLCNPDEITAPIESPLTLLTTEYMHHGAAAILYPGVLEKLAGDRNLFLIPASVHEFLCMEDDGSWEPESIERMIRNINHYEVERHDVLSDHLYYYDHQNKEVRLAC